MATALNHQVPPRSEKPARTAADDHEPQHHNPVRAALRGVGIFADTAVRVVLLGQAEPGRR